MTITSLARPAADRHIEATIRPRDNLLAETEILHSLDDQRAYLLGLAPEKLPTECRD
jgi:hypothetical protein